MLKQPACFSALPTEYQQIDGALHFINAPYKIGDRTTRSVIALKTGKLDR